MPSPGGRVLRSVSGGAFAHNTKGRSIDTRTPAAPRNRRRAALPTRYAAQTASRSETPLRGSGDNRVDARVCGRRPRSWRVPERVAKRVGRADGWNDERDMSVGPSVVDDDLRVAGVAIPLKRHGEA